MFFLRHSLQFCLRILRSRAAVELENLALRHQIDVFQKIRRKTPEINPRRTSVLDLSLPPLVRLAGIEFWRRTGPACIAFRYHYGRG